MSTVFPSDESVLHNAVRSSNSTKDNLGLVVALICVLSPLLIWRQIKSATTTPPPPRAMAHPAARATAATPPVLKFRDLAPDTAQAINAAMPVSTLPNPAARPFIMTSASAQDRSRSLDCLTQAVYYEAASEQIDGQRAVAQVVINRLRNVSFPKTVCGVVFQGAARTTSQGTIMKSGCQFSFACDGSTSRTRISWAWDRAQTVARAALNGGVMPLVGNATHYHTQWVAPYWSPSLTKIGQIGAHIFYRWAGNAGLPDAFHGRYAGGEALPQDASIKADPISTDVAKLAEAVVAIDKPVQIAKAAPAPVTLTAPVKEAEIDDSLPTIQLAASAPTPRDQNRPRSTLPSGW